jgi:hypothetical protein
MAASSEQKPGGGGGTGAAPFDPSVWMEAQRRNVEAFTNAGRIVADSMRVVAERQAAMMQEAMSELWGEVQAAGKGGGAAARQQQAGTQDGVERMRAAFERVTSQIQEISSVLLKAQGEAMQVLNACASANMQDLGKMAPDLAAMQKAAADAIQAATAQVTAAVEEMRRRMGELEGETRAAMAGAGRRSEEQEPQQPKRSGGGKSAR